MKKNILIIGGMGPQGSLILHERILKAATKNGAKDGQDFPKITHLSLPVKDFISDKTERTTALSYILESLYCLWRPTLHARCYCL